MTSFSQRLKGHPGASALFFLFCDNCFWVLGTPNPLHFWAPMEEFWIQLLAILTLLTQTCSISDTTELIGAVGGSVTFHIPKTEGSGAFWSFENEPIVTVPFKDPSQPVFYQDKLKTRFTVFERGRALTISQLRMEDAGTYSVNVEGKISTFTLHVYKELTEPTVTCEAQDCLGRICLFSLRCSVPGAGFGDVSYTWTGWDHLWEERSVVLAVVDKSSLDNVEPLTCTARNVVSSRSVTVTTPEGLCPEISTHPPGPGALSSSRVVIGIAIVIAVGVIVEVAAVVVILLVFLIFFCKSRGWRKFRVSQSESMDTGTTAEYMTVRAEVGPSQQLIPNGIKSKHMAGECSTTV